MGLLKKYNRFNDIHPAHLLTIVQPFDDDNIFYDRQQFHHLLHIEKMRAERSQKPLLLMLLDISAITKNGDHRDIPYQIQAALSPALRQVDIRGWYNHNQTIGVIFTEISSIDANSIEAIIRKIYKRFCESLDSDLINKINIFFHIYPKM
jgi:hypothetical protein